MPSVPGTTTVVDAVAAALRDQLLDGVLAPGHVLRDTALVDEFGVARPTIRAAVQVLVNDGLVTRDRGRSARVPVFAPADIADLYTARAAVEVAAVDLIERDAAPRLQHLIASHDRLLALGSDAAWRHVVDADVAFHQSLVAAADSPRLLRLFHGLANETRLVVALQRELYESVGDLVDEHTRILFALRRKRYDACRRLLRDHCNHSVAAMASAVDGRREVS